ncbi:hypothetical protein KVR01_008119 [Diaporthe batatas]|uniref:uncharacterized protein n=1 Tax=Diaporthe batatas TaxID=748121 RepID=UPI001D03E752|nr:uncharacterized protein KVR01_008119 [Diaporthe batatas]KAG8162354.1 hypothetical protein KVR01_008119 [Diaporthe batatas]
MPVLPASRLGLLLDTCLDDRCVACQQHSRPVTLSTADRPTAHKDPWTLDSPHHLRPGPAPELVPEHPPRFTTLCDLNRPLRSPHRRQSLDSAICAHIRTRQHSRDFYNGLVILRVGNSMGPRSFSICSHLVDNRSRLKHQSA